MDKRVWDNSLHGITGFQHHVYRISIFSARLSGMSCSLSMISCTERPRRLNSNFFLLPGKKKKWRNAHKCVCCAVSVNAVSNICSPLSDLSFSKSAALGEVSLFQVNLEFCCWCDWDERLSGGGVAPLLLNPVRAHSEVGQTSNC